MITNCNQTKGPNVSLTPDRSICQHYYFLLKVFLKKTFFSALYRGAHLVRITYNFATVLNF